MTKRLFCSVVIAAALSLAAGRPVAAQTVAPDLVSAQRDSGISGSSADLSGVEPAMKKAKPVCKPCLYYSGDFDSSGPVPNGLINGNISSISALAQIYSAFTVPSGKAWHVKGVFINTLSSVAVLDPAMTQWSIWTGVGSATPGELLFSGAGNATLTATGRSFLGYTEYTVSVKLKTIVLNPGTYWLNVTPQCANPSDSACSSALFYWSDVEDASPANHVGPANVLDDSFLNSTFYGYNYEPTWGGGACSGDGCDVFSFGLIGTN